VFDRIDPIPRGLGLNQTLTGGEIDASKVGLSFFLIVDRDFNPFVRFTPHITAEIPPEEMAFILEKDG
jgi:hypothetical protein